MGGKKVALPKKVEFAPAAGVEAYSAEIARILDALAGVTKAPGMRDAWVSDESWLSDFLGGDPARALAALEKKLGVEVDGVDMALLALAARLRARARTRN